MTMASMARATAAMALITGLAACGNGSNEGPGLADMTKQVVTQTIAQRQAPKAPQPAADPAAMAAEALSVNPGPLILAGMEGMGTTQVLAMMGENGNMRTYQTKNHQALILRDGMLVGTRGLGHDVSVVEADAATAQIRAGRSGQVQRTMRYYAGDGKERPLQFNCQITPGPKAGVLVEACSGHGITFQNNYLVNGGRIDVSRQWGGPGLGYITIQTLRH